VITRRAEAAGEALSLSLAHVFARADLQRTSEIKASDRK
jgi:hypothetical protein